MRQFYEMSVIKMIGGGFVFPSIVPAPPRRLANASRHGSTEKMLAKVVPVQ